MTVLQISNSGSKLKMSTNRLLDFLMQRRFGILLKMEVGAAERIESVSSKQRSWEPVGMELGDL